VRAHPRSDRARGHGTRARGRALWSAGAWLLLSALSACREHHATIDLPPLPPAHDASVREPLPDGSAACRRDSDCDDGVDCTRDLCVNGRYCANARDNSRCSDGIFCNGEETCEPPSGCRPGTPRRCNDDDVCTVDSCDEAGKQCVHDPRDFDGDGEADWHCNGGTDCDDFDATRSKNSQEICNDGVDNDCDDLVDERDGCTSALHDRCEDALDVGAGGKFSVDFGGSAPDYAIKCGELGAHDVAFTFTTEAAHDLTLVARGLLVDGTEETASIAVRTNCGEADTEIECSRGFPGEVRIRALPAGKYFVIVSSLQSSKVVLDVRFAKPTKAPTNVSCKHPLDISKGGRFSGDFVDVGDDLSIACGFDGSNDLVYTFTTEEARDVELSAISVTGERMNFAVRTDCEDADSTLRCVSDAPARARLYRLPAGTYYVVLESSPSREIEFDLDVAFLDPTDPPPGDGCAQPLELPLSKEVNGTLANRQDLVPVVCRCDPTQVEQGCNQFLPDVTYHVKVDAATDIGVVLNGASTVMDYDFRSTCDALDSQLACAEGTLINGRVRDVAPGDYYLVVESPDPANFTIKLDLLPRTIPMPVTDNDTCGKAIEIPPSGGLFTGDTLTMLNDYEALCGGNARSKDAAFHLTLPMRSRVKASLEAPFDAVLYRFTGEGAATCKSKAESVCNDDGGQGDHNSLLSELLEAGSYYYIVDGFNDNNAGKYLFEVTVAPE
jgi:hypothetical protein